MKENNTIIIGAGRLGGTIARNLHKKDNVLIIDKDKSKFSKLQDYSGFVECGDGTDLAFLEQCGIRKADRVIAVTNDDNVNIFIGDLCTKIFDVKDIVIKLKDSRKKSLVDDRVVCICPFDLFLDYFDNQSNGGNE